MRPSKTSQLAVAVALWIAFVGIRSAWGQATCATSSVPTIIRAQGITEAVGNIVVSNCSGAVPGGANLIITLFPSNIIITNSPAAGFLPTAVITTSAGGIPAISAVVPGSISGNTVSFALPATPVGVTLTSIQIGQVAGVPASVGIRVNASQLGADAPTQVSALLSVSPAGTLALTNPILSVALPKAGLSAGISQGGGIFQGAEPDLVGVPATASFTAGPTPQFSAIDTATGLTASPSSVPVFTLREGFASAFLVPGVPAAGNGEGADTSGIGTRLLIRFVQIPTNVVVYTPQSLTNSGATLSLTLVNNADSNGVGGTRPAPPSGATANRVTGRTITYEVATSSTQIEEEISVPIAFFTTGIPSPTGPIPAAVTLAPVSSVNDPTFISAAPIPRFADAPLPLQPSSLSLSPGGMSFAAPVGINPPPQTITISNPGGGTLNWAASLVTFGGGDWLSLSATSGTAPATISVLVNSANLAAGTYQAVLQFSAPQAINSPQNANVTLIVGTPSFSISSSSLLFSTSAGTSPAPQTFQLQNAGSGALNWVSAVATQSGGNWLSISPQTGLAPSIITVTINAASLSAGVYTATITFSTPTGVLASNSPQVVNVTLTVGAAAISSNGIVNGASFSNNGIISPGAVASLFGINLANGTFVVPVFPLPTLLLGTRVLVNNIPAFLFFVGPSQINFQAPADLTGTTAEVVVETNGVRSQSVTVAVAPELPGIFTIPAGGTGQGVVLNQDFSFNTPQNPAAVGSVIQIYATGLGASVPSVPSGQSAPSAPLSLTVARPVVLIGGVAVTDITFSGLTPGTAGGYQVNARIPAGAPTGNAVPLQIQIGSRTSNTVTIAIR
ncbi:MAG: hypothetical protein HY649_06775 [Acidobacteria bacterium]|nr:hypothetical protein [Acidobacteriota bacterium]